VTEPLDASTRAALQKLADIALPPPVSWWPQTWGWAGLLGLLLILAAWLTARGVKRYRANRYRRDALAELDRLERMLSDDDLGLALPALLKRVALAAWPRAEVAALSGADWVAFLRAHGGMAGFSPDAARLLDDLEYRPKLLGVDQTHVVAKAVRAWIEGHVVSA
jgi:hypothetical protein